jgi:hypothetical protein
MPCSGNHMTLLDAWSCDLGDFAKRSRAAKSGTMFVLSTCLVLLEGGGCTVFCTAFHCICT